MPYRLSPFFLSAVTNIDKILSTKHYIRMLKWLIIITSVYLSGCISSTAMLTPELRALHATQLAQKAGWKAHTIYTSSFILKAYGPTATKKVKTLTIYIEGDGLAWMSADTPSNNPSPIVATGLELATRDQAHERVAYLARPCQFLSKQEWGQCRQEDWTRLRFAPEVVYAMNQGVTYLKQYHHAKQLILIGYSGGGTIAALIAARRHDVVQLITIAAVLDTTFWVNQENLTPLDGSLNPADEWKSLAAIPQTHWVGGQDSVVPKEVTLAFVQRFDVKHKPKIKVMPTFTHHCCWIKKWSSLLNQTTARLTINSVGNGNNKRYGYLQK